MFHFLWTSRHRLHSAILFLPLLAAPNKPIETAVKLTDRWDRSRAAPYYLKWSGAQIKCTIAGQACCSSERSVSHEWTFVMEIKKLPGARSYSEPGAPSVKPGWKLLCLKQHIFTCHKSFSNNEDRFIINTWAKLRTTKYESSPFTEVCTPVNDHSHPSSLSLTLHCKQCRVSS